MPSRNSSDDSLPWPVIELATDLFARQYGLSGPDIHRLLGRYTDALGPYPMDDKPSRWMIFQRGMGAVSADEQREILRGLLDHDWADLDTDELDSLRQLLAGGSRHSSRQLGERLERLDWETVDRNWQDTIDLVERSPEGAIRAARTSLESICKHICDERGEPYEDSWDLSRLYKAAAKCLVIAPNQHTEQVIKQILSGVATTVEGLAGLRNALSDAHGSGKGSVRPASRHARLAVNVSFAAGTFLIDTHLEKEV